MNRRLDGLKSAHEKSRTIKNTSGSHSSNTRFDFDNQVGAGVDELGERALGAGQFSHRVRSQKDLSAPAARNRPESVGPATYSSLRANGCSGSVSQPQASPVPK